MRGDPINPITFNPWLYVNGNPIALIDPSGYIAVDEAELADSIVQYIQQNYLINVIKDWGYLELDTLPIDVDSFICRWNEGEWTIEELNTVRFAAQDLSQAFRGANKLSEKLGGTNIRQAEISSGGLTIGSNITLTTGSFDKWVVVHELAHVWDFKNFWLLSLGLEAYTGGVTDPSNRPENCDADVRLPGCNEAGYFYMGVPPKGSDLNFNRVEDFSEAVTAYVYPEKAKDGLQAILQSYQLNRELYDLYRRHLYYDDYTQTERFRYIDGLISGQIKPVVVILGRWLDSVRGAR